MTALAPAERWQRCSDLLASRACGTDVRNEVHRHAQNLDLSLLEQLLTLPALLGLGAPSGRGPAEPIAQTDEADRYGVPLSADRFESEKAVVSEKLRTALLPAMRAQVIDMWIVLDRENNPDPLHEERGGGFSGGRGSFPGVRPPLFAPNATEHYDSPSRRLT